MFNPLVDGFPDNSCIYSSDALLYVSIMVSIQLYVRAQELLKGLLLTLSTPSPVGWASLG